MGFNKASKQAQKEFHLITSESTNTLVPQEEPPKVKDVPSSLRRNLVLCEEEEQVLKIIQVI